MSATQDKSQKIAFVYQNMHALYRRGLEAAQAAPSATAPSLTGVVRGKVIKAYENSSVQAHAPAHLIGKRIEIPASIAAPAPVEKPTLSMESQRNAIESLQGNLKTLGDLHSRLRFMLKELEELVKE